MKHTVFLLVLFLSFSSIAQTFQTTPAFPTADESLTLTVDVSGTSLEGYSNDVWLWTWLSGCAADCDAPTNVNPATSAQDAAKLTRSGSDANVYSITFTPTTFFDKSKEEITRVGFKLKSIDWADNKQSDIDLFIEISSGELEVAFSTPTSPSFLIDTSETFTINAQSSQSADLTLSIGGVIVSTTNGTTINYSHTVTETSGSVDVVIVADDGASSVEDSFTYSIRESTVLEALPAGIREGINYDAVDETKVTLCLLAPGKTSGYVLGEFNNWQIDPSYQMKLDGEYFWLEIAGLVSGQEYAFQYLIDETLYIGDPYTDKILDPDNDPFISNSSYPDLKTYPSGGKGLVSVLQTGQTPYTWQVDNFEAPAKEDLVIYELLIRDFDDSQNYQGMVDRLDYLEELGINAIGLMPIMEFDANLSWGYNPGYFFAPDKYYGTKNALKALIDECHARGMAVLLDMVLNHTHEDNPLAQLYWNEAQFKPAVNNPWLNVEATHPFNVFYDFNHESTYTQDFVDSVNHYWLKEYQFDGYRFDLSKGFTQKNNINDVGAWGAYDQSRVDILKRMTDEIWNDFPDAFVIFEHLSDNSEEKVLADYGILLWGNMNVNYNQLTMGHEDNSSIDWSYFGTRGWNDPNLISYMESHDEERLIYRNINFGNSSNTNYDTKNLDIALERVKAASAIFYAIPGPKLLWQFGELGYDFDINLNGRTGEKPVPWSTSEDGLDYEIDTNRKRLYDLTSTIIKLKTTYDVFELDNFTLNESQTLVKQIQLLNDPYTSTPAIPEDMNVVVVANFNVTETEIEVSLPHVGNWYHYFAEGRLFEVSSTTETISLQPGEFRIYTDVQLPSTAAELTNHVVPSAPTDLLLDQVVAEGVSLSWTDNSIIESNYEIWRADNGSALTMIGTEFQDTESFLDVTAKTNVTYTYAVMATNEYFDSSADEATITTTSIITDLDDIITKGDFEVFPNPFNNIVIIKSSDKFQRVKVVDMAGKIQRNFITGDTHSIEIDVRDLPAGVYMIEIGSDLNTNKVKMIKQN